LKNIFIPGLLFLVKAIDQQNSFLFGSVTTSITPDTSLPHKITDTIIVLIQHIILH